MNSMLDLIEKCLKKNTKDYVREPTIPTRLGTRHPDLIVALDNQAMIIDLTITSDHVPMSVANNAKIEYYTQDDIISWTRARFTQCQTVSVKALVLNWRCESSTVIKQMGIPLADQMILSVRCLTYNANMHKHFGKSTTRHL